MNFFCFRQLYGKNQGQNDAYLGKIAILCDTNDIVDRTQNSDIHLFDQ